MSFLLSSGLSRGNTVTLEKKRRMMSVSPARLGRLEKIKENFYKNLMEILTCVSGNLNLAKCKEEQAFSLYFCIWKVSAAGTI